MGGRWGGGGGGGGRAHYKEHCLGVLLHGWSVVRGRVLMTMVAWWCDKRGKGEGGAGESLMSSFQRCMSGTCRF